MIALEETNFLATAKLVSYGNKPRRSMRRKKCRRTCGVHATGLEKPLAIFCLDFSYGTTVSQAVCMASVKALLVCVVGMSKTCKKPKSFLP